jgi:hypothetical protein
MLRSIEPGGLTISITREVEILWYQDGGLAGAERLWRVFANGWLAAPGRPAIALDAAGPCIAYPTDRDIEPPGLPLKNGS